jgi:hypothetical protein
MSQYSVYKIDDLKNKFNTITDKSEDVIKFFNTFTFNNIINENLAKGNSAYIFKNVIKEDTTRAKILGLLNKLHQQNLTKIISMIREIVFQTQDELNELVNQCIQKIKRDSEQIRPLVAALCWELLSTFFVTVSGEKIYFRKLLLSEVKSDYIKSVDYENEEWTKDHSEKSMILIGTLFNSKIIENKIMTSIINDFKKNIQYHDDCTPEYYEKVEKAIQQLSCIVSCIVLNEESKKIYDDLDIFLEKQIEIYEEKKCISKKIRLICKNVIYELRK